MSSEELANPLLPSTYDLIWTVGIVVLLVVIPVAVITLTVVLLRRGRRPGADAPRSGA